MSLGLIVFNLNTLVKYFPLKLLKCIVFYLLLSPHDCEKWDLLQRIKGMRELEKLPQHKELLKLFIRQELIFWKETIEGEYSEILFGEKATDEKMAIDGVASLMPNLEVFLNMRGFS